MIRINRIKNCHTFPPLVSHFLIRIYVHPYGYSRLVANHLILHRHQQLLLIKLRVPHCEAAPSMQPINRSPLQRGEVNPHTPVSLTFQYRDYSLSQVIRLRFFKVIITAPGIKHEQNKLNKTQSE